MPLVRIGVGGKGSLFGSAEALSPSTAVRVRSSALLNRLIQRFAMTLGQAPLFFGSRLDGVPHLPAQPSCIGIYATHNEDGPMSLQPAIEPRRRGT